MGWKASCVLIREAGAVPPESTPEHDPARAARVAAALRPGTHRSRGMTTLDEGIYPERLVIGAYDGLTVVGHPRVVYGCLRPSIDALTVRAAATFPDAAVMRLGLNSVVNLWGYALLEGGRLVRAYGGSADAGVELDLGDPLPEEQPHFARSFVRDGVRVFRTEIGGEPREFEAPAYGEELAFAVMARFLGTSPDQPVGDNDPLEWPMEAFETEPIEPEPARRGWWPWGKGRGRS